LYELTLLLGTSGEESEESGCASHAQYVVDEGSGRAKHVETAHDDKREEESVVVEDGEGCRLVVCHLVLLPQHALVLLLSCSSSCRRRPS